MFIKKDTTSGVNRARDMGPKLEAGFTTTEFWFSAVSALVTTTIGLLVAFGVPLTVDQKAAILGVTAAALPVIAGAYAISRGIRKQGGL